MVRAGAEMPFILKFLKYRKGVSSGTTSGVWNDVDANDKD